MKIRLYYMRYFFILLFLGATVACKKKPTTWNSDWVVPLVNDTMTLGGYVNDSTLGVDGMGNYLVQLKRDLFNIGLNDIVAIPDTTIAQNYTLSVSSLDLAPGSNFVNSVEEHELNLEDLELKKIKLHHASIDLEVLNPLETEVILTLNLPGVEKNGSEFSVQYTVEAGTNANPGELHKSVRLDDYWMDFRGIDGGAFNLLQSQINVQTSPDGQAVTITNEDVTTINATFKNVELSYARGYFGNRLLEDTTSFSIDFFDNVVAGTIDLPATEVRLIVENGVRFDAEAKLNFLKNTNTQENEVALSGTPISQTYQIDPAINSYENLEPSTTTITFNSGNSNIENFMENLGVDYDVSHDLGINPWGNTSGGWNEIFPQSRLKLQLEMDMPLQLEADNLTIVDTFAIEFNQNKEKTHITSGKFTADIANAFPFQSNLVIHLLDEDENVLTSIPASTILASSVFGNLDENNVLVNHSTLEFVLQKTTVDQLNEIKFMIVEAVFNTPNASNVNEQVVIPANAYLHAKIKADFELKNSIN